MDNIQSKTKTDEIKCPGCGTLIPISETLRHQLTEETRNELPGELLEQRQELSSKEKSLQIKEQELVSAQKNVEKIVQQKLEGEREKLREEAVKKAREDQEVELKDLKAQVAEGKAKVRKTQEKELELLKKERELASVQKDIEKTVQEKLEGEREKLKETALKKAREDQAIEMKDLKTQLQEKNEKIQKIEERELELRKKEREVEESKKSLALELEKRIEKEKKKIEEEVASRISEERQMKDAEKDKQINDLIKQTEEWRRKALQGSQQAQGEILEVVLEEFLKANFLNDNIQPVPKGMPGADVLQHVYTNSGSFCGIIIWESKRTKNWSDVWIQKLKDNQREAKAGVAVLVTETLPNGIKNFGQKDGIWITTYPFILGLATALRGTLTQVAMTRLASRGKNEKIEVLFNYLTGPEFKHRVEAIVETFAIMQGDLEKEKRTFQVQWAKREKNIRRVLDNTSGMYGDLQGLIGSSMQPIPALEAGEVEKDNEEGESKET